jgi:hypothetical protein
MSLKRPRAFIRRRKAGEAKRFPGGSLSDDDLGLDLRIRVRELALPAIDEEVVIRGRLIAGDGSVSLSLDGIAIAQGDRDLNKLRFLDVDDLVGELYADTDAGVQVTTILRGKGKDGGTHEALLALIASTDDGAAHAGAAAVSLNLSTANDAVDIDAGTIRTNGAFVHNEAGADHDFRVEGDTASHLLFCDAGGDQIGIKTAAPTAGCSLDFGSAEAVRLPRLTSSQRDGLTPAGGMLIFNTTLAAVQAYDGSTWVTL